LAKILSTGITLKEYAGSRVYRGITTGLNEAFLVEKNKILADGKLNNPNLV
jgi:hypothetical protein